MFPPFLPRPFLATFSLLATFSRDLFSTPFLGTFTAPPFRVTFSQTPFFCESSSLRINQRHHSLRTRLWYTPPAAVKKPTEENTRERDLGVGVGRDSRSVGRYGRRSMCVPTFPPRDPAPRCSPLSSSSLLLSPPDPTPSTRPTGLWRGTQGPPGASSRNRLVLRLISWARARRAATGERSGL